MSDRVASSIGEVIVHANDRMRNDWLLAADVHAHTREPVRGNRSLPNSGMAMTVQEFAKQGIRGLRKHETVARWRRTWQYALDHGAKPLVAGDAFVEPDIDFDEAHDFAAAENDKWENVQERHARSYITKNPRVVAEAIKANPAVANAVAADDEAMTEVSARSFTNRATGTPTGPVAPAVATTIHPDKDINDALDRLNIWLGQEQQGQRSADGLLETRLRLLTIRLNERVARIDGDAAPDTITSINAYLKASK